MTGPAGPFSLVVDDASLLNFIQENAGTVNHPSGTCAMSTKGIGGVVDSQLRVRGTSGLRVVDASVFVSVTPFSSLFTILTCIIIQPTSPNCHIQAVVYTVAERAAGFIKEQYGLGG